MKVLTIGNGFVAEHLPHEILGGNERVVANSIGQMQSIIEQYKPDVIVNCIGKTGRPNVDWCETHKEETASANVVLPIVLAEVCAKHSVRLVQIGSGCIYFGESPNFHYVQADGKPMPDVSWNMPHTVTLPAKKIDDGWMETDFANPKSFYSKSKYACDLMIGSMSHVTTLRIRMPISTRNTSRNLINKLRGYKQVIDIPNSVTFMDDLARCVDWAIQNEKTGIFHVTNPEPLTAAQVMREYQKYVPSHSFEIISEQQLDGLTTAKRSNCIINSDKLAAAGFTMTPAKQALADCMAKYVKNL
jgi:dTDP-4-dehydrorhamnose reductase